VDHGEKRDLLLTLGADEALDYAREDFTRSGKKYDLILDVASTLSLADGRRVLTPSGLYVLIGHDHYGAKGGGWLGSLPRFFALTARAPFDRHLPKVNTAMPDKRAILEELRSLLEKGKLTPIVDRVFPLEEAPAALRRLQGGAAKGRILLVPG
jgi:NADPH:quinone reductase-like Zn-dependent oxidoreductase